MNYYQLSQWIRNNAWFGEQRRPGDGRSFVSHSLVTPNYGKEWGIDISPWDGLVNLSVTKSLGAKIVYIKAIDGTIQAKYFPENRQSAKDAGLLDGAYGWLYRNQNVSCVKQAQAYDALLNKYPVTLPPAIDFEPTKWGGVQSNPTYSDLRLWATEWLRLGNPKAILYSAKYFMDPLGKIPADLKEMFAGLWVANYGVVNPAMPLGYLYDEWIIHQFASDGDAATISPNSVNKREVDLNYSKFGIVTEPPTEGEPMLYKGTVLVNSLRMRVSPVTSASIVRNLAKNDKIEAVGVDKGWWTIVKVNNDVIAGYAYEGSVKDYIRTDSVTPSGELAEIAGAVANLSQKVTALQGDVAGVMSDISGLLSRVAALENATPEPQPTSDGYLGKDMGIYKILDLPDMQTGNAITTIQDSYGNEMTIVMDKMVRWMEANCPGWADFVKNGSVEQRPDGLWWYEIRLIKGQLVRIAEVGGKTKDNPLGNGRIVGMDSEGDPLRGAVNMDAVGYEQKKTPYYFHKVPGVPRYFPIIQPRQQKQMEVMNAWWIPMKWLEKVK